MGMIVYPSVFFHIDPSYYLKDPGFFCGGLTVVVIFCFRPVLHLPGPSKATITVRCCPVLFELRKIPRKREGMSNWIP